MRSRSARCSTAPDRRGRSRCARQHAPVRRQRRLEIARALAAAPAIVMLDEPAAGMNPSETVRLVETIRGIAEGGIGVLLIEHDMSLVRAPATASSF